MQSTSTVLRTRHRGDFETIALRGGPDFETIGSAGNNTSFAGDRAGAGVRDRPDLRLHAISSVICICAVWSMPPQQQSPRPAGMPGRWASVRPAIPGEAAGRAAAAAAAAAAAPLAAAVLAALSGGKQHTLKD